ncbi:hypothetical protein OOT46_05420 [Aquabacterium sp. A7-Y]|uniref:hypothetical protein n=1 Tax=Aquabacterium sp. A7-Y TaxID=1349605 RepID=UPI00223E809D|nr:hypothetical protein [Aquabacterium sp. A7-Y]MCW7537290.1 hypothetical protein [Aquabacterium sp. A7-Y]
MLQHLANRLGPPLLERLTLALNHVLASEPLATQRLAPHAGRTLQVRLTGVPKLLHWPELLAFRITPAGLLEIGETTLDGAADLDLVVDASQPRLMVEAALSGQRPPVSIRGDAQLATDIGWLMDNLRWDYEDDLARIVGPVVAHQAALVIRAVSGAARQALAALSRLVPGGAAGDTRAADRRPS